MNKRFTGLQVISFPITKKGAAIQYIVSLNKYASLGHTHTLNRNSQVWNKITPTFPAWFLHLKLGKCWKDFRTAKSLKTIHHLGVSKNNGTPKSWILIGFSIINHPFSGTPIFGNTHLKIRKRLQHIHHFQGVFSSVKPKLTVQKLSVNPQS